MLQANYQLLKTLINFILNLQLGVWRIHVQDVPLYQHFEYYSLCSNFGGNLHRTIFGHNTSNDVQTNVDAESATGKIEMKIFIICINSSQKLIFYIIQEYKYKLHLQF